MQQHPNLKQPASPRSEQLPTDYLSLCSFRQFGKETDYRKSVIFGPDLEIAVGHGCWISAIILSSAVSSLGKTLVVE